jgi:hypothetical protein
MSKRRTHSPEFKLFTRGKKTKDKEEGQTKEAELFQQIGRLQMELDVVSHHVRQPSSSASRC